MEVKTRIENHVAIMEIVGRLSAESAESLRTAFLEVFNTNRRFVFDLENLEYLDSTGLGVIVFCLKSCNEFKGTLKLANLKNKPRMIFEITKAHRIFDIYDSVEAAVVASNA